MFLKNFALGHDFTELSLCAPLAPAAAEREKWEALPRILREEMASAAAKHLETPWPALLAADYMEYRRTGDRGRYEGPHFARRRKLQSLILGECAEYKGRFLDEIVNGLWLICEESYWGVSAHTFGPHLMLPDTQNPYIDLFAAETGQLIAYALYLLGDELGRIAPELPDRLDRELARRIREPYLTREDFGWMGFGGRRVNNWNPWINSNILTIFILSEPDKFRRARAVKKALLSLDVFISGYGPDGGCDEGISYWSRAAGSLFEALDILYRAGGGKIDFFGEELLRQMALYVPRMHISGRYFVNFADGGAMSAPNGRLLYRFGRALNDKTVADAGAALKTPPLAGGLMQILPALFDGEGYENGREMPVIKDVYMPDIQVFAAREEAEEARGLYAAAKGGHNGESHNHNDIGSFVLFSDGAPVIVDAGVGAYTKKTFSGERYSLWYMQSGWHSVPVINGQMQSPGERFAASGAEYKAGEDFAEFSCDIAGAYPGEAKIRSARRKIRLERGEKPRLVLSDEFLFSGPGNGVSLCFLLAREPEISPEGIFLNGENGQRLRLFFEGPLSPAVEEKKIDPADAGMIRVWGGSLYRLSLSGQIQGDGLITKILIERA